MEHLVKDGEVVRVHRERVDVVARFCRDGTLLPVMVIWRDGRRFHVDEVMRIGAFGPEHHGRHTMAYDVRFGDHETTMFLEHRPATATTPDKAIWWVRAKDSTTTRSTT